MGKSSGGTRTSASNNPRGMGGGRIIISEPNGWGLVRVSGKDIDDIRAIGMSDYTVGGLMRERYGDIQNGGGDVNGVNVYDFEADAGEGIIKNYVREWAQGARLLKKYWDTHDDADRRAYNEWVEEYRLRTRRMNHPEEFD